MRTLVLLFSSLAAISARVPFAGQNPAFGHSQSTILEGNFSVPLNHFSPTNGLRVQLKYEVNVEFFKEGGPLLFLTQAGWSGGLHPSALMHQYAQKVNGALIKADFRYQGDNYFGDMELQRELRYFTVEHILADIPYLVNEVKKRLTTTSSRVIMFGELLGGSIAVLARKRFPHIIDAAWSSSGLFRSVLANTDTFEAIAKQTHQFGGANCTAMLSKTFRELKQLVDDRNIEKIRELLRIEEDQVIDLDDPQHVQHFFKEMFRIATYFYFDRVEHITFLCKDIVSEGDGFESFLRYYRTNFGHVTPLFSYNVFLKSARSPINQAIHYFDCFQIGSNRPVTIANSFQNVYPDVITEQYYDQLCTDIYGARYNRTQLESASHGFNSQHGGSTQYVSNTVFSDGKLNPYFSIGVSEYDPNSSKFITTEYKGARMDEGFISDIDSEELKAAKERIVATLSSYIQPADDVN